MRIHGKQLLQLLSDWMAVAGAVLIADAQIRAENYRSAAIIAASQPQPRTLYCNAYRTGTLISVQCN